MRVPASFLMLSLLLLGCGDGSSSRPTPLPTPSGAVLAVFTARASGFSTSDVRDSNDDVVRFDTVEDTLIWTAGDLVFDGFAVDGNYLDAQRLYEVKFGTVSGEHRAYFTEAATGTLCDLRVESGRLTISPTSLLPPPS